MARSGSAYVGYSNRRKDSRKEGLCSVGFLKYILFIFNFLFLVGGCAVLGVGIWTLTSQHDHIVLLTTMTFVSAAALLIVAGVLVILSAITGCYALAKEHRCSLLLYTFALLLIFLLEAIGGILAYMYEEQIMVELTHTLTDTFNENYGVDAEITKAISKMQIQYHCCGALEASQWKNSVWKSSGNALNNTVPDTCCKTISLNCGVRDHPSNIWSTGCIHRLEEEIREHLLLLGAIACGISVLQVIGLVLSCCLYVKLKDVEDY